MLYIFVCLLSQNGLTPLHVCARYNRVEVAKILLKYRAEINVQTKVSHISMRRFDELVSTYVCEIRKVQKNSFRTQFGQSG